ncbi:discoidin domain-containing protein [Actinomyces bovis]
MTAGHVYVVVPTASVKAKAAQSVLEWGSSTTVNVTVAGTIPADSTLELRAPEGWSVAEGAQSISAAGTYTFTVTAPKCTAGPASLEAVLSSGSARTSARVALEVTDPAVIAQSQMKIKEVSSQETGSENGAAANLLDGDPSTYWHSDWSSSNPQPPHQVTVDLGKVEKVESLTWTPRQNTDNGLIKEYEIWAAADEACTPFTKVTSGSWPKSRSAKTVALGGASARCVKLVSTAQAWTGNWATGAELTMKRVVDAAPAPGTPTASPSAVPSTPPSSEPTAQPSPSETPLGPSPLPSASSTAAPTTLAPSPGPQTPAPSGVKPAYVASAEAAGTGFSLYGDWDGDGTVTWAVRVGTRVVFYNENRSEAPVYASISIGRANDKLLVGDWDGDGKDTLALWRGTTVLTQDRLTSTATTKVEVPGLTSSTKSLVVRPGVGPKDPDTIGLG